ncbi:hypothetical protein BDZ89DRAFT_499550 [Hymenopellis radicata]|nr:hypothetical protein BDZ89DRAFT_499550 [Hymenopellis radicata]
MLVFAAAPSLGGSRHVSLQDEAATLLEDVCGPAAAGYASALRLTTYKPSGLRTRLDHCCRAFLGFKPRATTYCFTTRTTIRTTMLTTEMLMMTSGRVLASTLWRPRFYQPMYFAHPHLCAYPYAILFPTVLLPGTILSPRIMHVDEPCAIARGLSAGTNTAGVDRWPYSAVYRVPTRTRIPFARLTVLRASGSLWPYVL